MDRGRLDELAAVGEELLAGMARMRETVDAMGRSLSVLERTAAELRQDVTRLGERVDRLERGSTGSRHGWSGSSCGWVGRRGSNGGSGCMTDRCREERTAVLRRLIEDAEPSGISECSVDAVFAEARALSDELGRQAAE